MIVGRSTPFSIPTSVRIASTAPAAPIVWPSIDLFDDTGTRFARSPSTRLIAAVSIGSFIAVEVPWAFTYSIASGEMRASASARCMAIEAPSPSGCCSVMRNASVESP